MLMAFTDDAPVSMISWEKKTKYRNRKTTVDGIVFDSSKEASRWSQLKLLKAADKIEDLQRQARLKIVINKEPVCDYVADFTYIDAVTGCRIIEDVKSKYTKKLPLYRLKKKLVKACLGIEIREV